MALFINHNAVTKAQLRGPLLARAIANHHIKVIRAWNSIQVHDTNWGGGGQISHIMHKVT